MQVMFPVLFPAQQTLCLRAVWEERWQHQGDLPRFRAGGRCRVRGSGQSPARGLRDGEGDLPAVFISLHSTVLWGSCCQKSLKLEWILPSLPVPEELCCFFQVTSASSQTLRGVPLCRTSLSRAAASH